MSLIFLNKDLYQHIQISKVILLILIKFHYYLINRAKKDNFRTVIIKLQNFVTKFLKIIIEHNVLLIYFRIYIYVIKVMFLMFLHGNFYILKCI